jgi:putative endonuclease
MGNGPLGEQLAELFLVSRGWVVRGRNVRAGRREVDLVVQRGRTLVFVEVKWRRGDAAEAWRAPQRARAGEAALQLLGQYEASAFRFDLVTIVDAPSGWTLTHLPGAWSPGGTFW